jgi:hypothetical protein
MKKLNLTEADLKDQTFKVKYFAKKHDKVISRIGKWTDDCKVWTSSKGDVLLTYFDTEKNNFRTAKDVVEILGYVPDEVNVKK